MTRRLALVGLGPGDAELVTEQAARVLNEVDYFLVADKTEKHPVTPGPIIPARELLGDMLMQAGKPQEALAAYEHSMQVEPNRFRGLAGAARAAEAAGDKAKAQQYYARLLKLAEKGDGDRPIIKQAQAFTGVKQ